jgi:nicotinamidase-related amidase
VFSVFDADGQMGKEAAMDATELIGNSEPFLRYLAEWEAGRPTMPLERLAADPQRVAIMAVDLINGFCNMGSLASPRIQGIVAPSAELFQRAEAAGVAHLIRVQEAHEPEALEFAQFPAHGVRGTAEAEAVPELRALPFFDQMRVFTKNSIHPAFNSGLERWLEEHGEVDTFVVVGDCTDLCTYQTAMYLKLRGNALQLSQRVVVPANCVQTFDTPPALARQIGAMAHDGDLLHLVFLYSMALNGIEVVAAIA